MTAPDRPALGAAALGAAEMGGQGCLFTYLFFYGEDGRAAVERDEAAWRGWLDGRLAAAGEGGDAGS
ncbi:MAG TPA: hypothetical protein VM617_08665 [Thermoanaerobaculia bacterium]|nr:hypothetical protein [Thermoanaerobaculia bacterium]